jgi:hypothetical protein
MPALYLSSAYRNRPRQRGCFFPVTTWLYWRSECRGRKSIISGAYVGNSLSNFFIHP